ncbi:MAG: dihydroorotase [Rikenellaceae bacterium]|jgi:dihydroorotase|nr:dihydroorotase [Rikenellaceae bacterium]
MILIENGLTVNEGETFVGYLLVDGQRILDVGRGEFRGMCGGAFAGERIDATGMLVIPGAIDDHVHFREPGLVHKGDIFHESRAAVAGGVTSFMEMPNTVPSTVSAAELERKYDLAAEHSLTNYSFYLGATSDNIREIARLDPRHVCGVKIFMGSSTGDMLLDDNRALSAVFDQSPVPVAAHCEDEGLVRRAAVAEYRARYGDEAAAELHPLVRSAEACYRSTAQAVELADRYGADLHVLHISTARELGLFEARPLREKRITAEACVHHLWFSDEDYARLGNLIKINPSVKSIYDREALRGGLADGRIDVVATDHAPHTLEEKLRPYWNAPPGAPMVQHSLAAMLSMFPAEMAVEKMCHAPAVRFGLSDRGFLRQGMYADIAIVDPSSPWTVSREDILYKCGWSPLEGVTLSHRVVCTLVNGRIVNRGGVIDENFRGARLEFSR